MKDKLDQLFEMQRALNKRYGVDTNEIAENPQLQTEWVLNYSRALAHELTELEDSVSWSWWKNYSKPDIQNARVEVVDMLHFLISLAQVLGMDADDLFDAYLKKNKVNHARQRSGYRVKDEDDCKHI